jgi:hypothetical protein
MRQIVFFFGILLLFSPYLNAQKPVQNIRGLVVDANTGQKLFGANVILPDENKGSITDEDGYFFLQNIPVGRYHLQVSFIGYEPVIIPELLVASGREVVLNIKMEPSVSKIEELTVKPSIRKDKPINSMANVSARTFSVEETSRYAGALDDPGRMAGNFAGVTSMGASVNAIVIRGNAPKGVLWRLEGVDIPVPSHFSGSNVAGGGGLTVFSSRLLANSDFYTGAFPAEFGNATAGVFDMKLRNGNNRKREYSFQIGVQGIEAAAEGPFLHGKPGSYLFNYRYSTMALIFPLLPELEGSDEVPVYQDLSFKLNFPGTRAGTFSIWGIGGMSMSKMKGTDDPDKWLFPESRVRMTFNYNMGAGGITHSKSLNSKTYLRTTLAINSGEHKYHKESRLSETQPGKFFTLYNIDRMKGALTLSSSITHVPLRNIKIRAGLDASQHFFDLDGNAWDYFSQDLREILDGNGRSLYMNGFIQGNYKFETGISLSAGLNGSWFEMNDDFRIEPRFSAGWQIMPGHRLSAGYGMHSQIEPLFVYYISKKNDIDGDFYLPNKKLDRMGAHHFVIAYDLRFTPNFRLKVEPYYQKLYKVPVVEGSSYSMINFKSDWTFDQELVNMGSGINRGVDFTLERFLKDGYYFMSTFSLYNSTYKDADGIEHKTRYDGGYVFNILGGGEWHVREKNMIGLNFKFTVMGPYWHHPVDEEATLYQGQVVYNEDEPFIYRYSNREYMSDFSLTYRINGMKTSSVFALNVKNLFGQQYMGKRFNLKTREIENDFFKSTIPFVSYKVEF